MPHPQYRDHGWEESKPGPPTDRIAFFGAIPPLDWQTNRRAKRTAWRHAHDAADLRELRAYLFGMMRREQLPPGERLGLIP